ncbi:MAG: tripartite tricarboxylate transporter substrate binding protein [Alcaligenaceae bacterium]|nr:tripartite tricarboxylate transporter substrate binding protein [Alcaligenaceae bacterium]
MTLKIKSLSKKICAGLGISLIAFSAQAAYPERPIRIITPFAPGTGPDTNAREVANELQKNLGVSVIIDNKPGASGAIGNAAAAQAKPDGYTLLIGSTSTLSIHPHLYSKKSYDIEKDFIPVSLLGAMNTGLIASPTSKVADVKDMIEKLKTDPGKYNIATMGLGSYSHLSGEWFGFASNTKPVFIPYSTTSPFADLMAGQVDFLFDALPAAAGGIQTGKLKLLAITGNERHPSFPDIPTFQEIGIENFDPAGWQGLLAPAGTPDDVIKVLGEAMQKVNDNKELAERWEKTYIGKLVGSTPEEFKTFISEDSAKWKKVIDRAEIKLD